MRFITVALCLLAIQVYIVLAVVPQPPPVVVANSSTEERKKQPLDYSEWSITDQYSDPELWENDCVDGPEHGGHGHGHEHDKDHKRKCPRVHPLTKKGPFQVSYEFKKAEIVPDLLAVAPVHYVEVRAQAINHVCGKTMFSIFNGFLTTISFIGGIQESQSRLSTGTWK